MMAHVRHVLHTLRSPSLKSPSSEAMAHVFALFDRTVPKAAGDMAACRKGCFHCCSQMVIVTAPEAFFVAAQVRKRPDLAAAVREAAREIGNLSMEERLGRQVFCPMLSEAMCSIYAGRPLGCRGFVSTELEACLAAFERGGTPDIPMPNDTVSVLYACRMLLMAALRLGGLGDASYELNSAVALALSGDDTEARWLAGEKLFDILRPSPPPPPQFEIAIRDLVAHTAPTV